MWMQLLLTVISSETTKQLIAYAIKKLLEHKSDGITKDVINIVIDGAVQSKSNTLKEEDVLGIREALQK